MKNIFEEKKCVMCKYELYSVADSPPGGWSIYCFRCGYYLEAKDELGNMIFTPGSSSFDISSNEHNYAMNYDEHLGYGMIYMEYIDGHKRYIAINRQPTQIFIGLYKKELESTNVDKSKSYFVLFNPSTKKIDVIHGKIPNNPN